MKSALGANSGTYAPPYRARGPCLGCMDSELPLRKKIAEQINYNEADERLWIARSGDYKFHNRR